MRSIRIYVVMNAPINSTENIFDTHNFRLIDQFFDKINCKALLVTK